jgi:hypothetical protein
MEHINGWGGEFCQVLSDMKWEMDLGLGSGKMFGVEINH